MCRECIKNHPFLTEMVLCFGALLGMLLFFKKIDDCASLIRDEQESHFDGEVNEVNDGKKCEDELKSEAIK